RRTETTIARGSEPATTRAIATTPANASDFDLAGRRWRRRDFQRRQLHVELNFACRGELPEDVAIDHQPRILLHAGHALRESPRGLIECPRPGVGADLEIDINRQHLAPPVDRSSRRHFGNERATAQIVGILPAAELEDPIIPAAVA